MFNIIKALVACSILFSLVILATKLYYNRVDAYKGIKRNDPVLPPIRRERIKNSIYLREEPDFAKQRKNIMAYINRKEIQNKVNN